MAVLCHLRLAAAACLALLSVTPACAGGSIAFVDAMQNFDPPSALIDEIEKAAREANVKADEIICDATRFGPQWTRISGGRASPYECPIGKRTLVISGRHEYRDALGKVLPQDGLALEEHAASVRDVDITWEWK